jgi:holo-[acyl-carrier protein] synthase
VELAEVEHSLATFGQRYLDRIFTDAEQADCTGQNHVHRLAARFAAKEAAVKAFAVPDGPFVPRELEVVMDGAVPTLRLSGAAAALARAQGWTDVALTLSHADCHATAVVVVMCSGDDHTSNDRRLGR